MEKTKIIGISGKIGSGKSLFSDKLAETLNTNVLTAGVECHAYADKLKEIVELITGYKMTKIDDSPYYNTIYNYTQKQKDLYLPLWDKTIGQCLQVIGTECMRNHFDPDTWVKSLFATSGKKCIERGNVLIVPDVRFSNEADYLLEQGGKLIRMEGDPMNVRKNSTRDLNHISETALDDYKNFSAIIKNEEPDIKLLKEKMFRVIEDFNIG